MSDGINLIGYSSDELSVGKLFAPFIRKTKKQRDKEKQDKLFEINPLSDSEWFVYFVNGGKRYYKAPQDINELLKFHPDAVFLGIGRPNETPHKQVPTEKKKQIPFKKYIKELNTLCCYCECILNFHDGLKPNSATKDHVIPKHRGGKTTKPCCFQCNQEKGGLMLHSYIQMLNLMMLQVTGDELVKLQTKIKNANRIAKEINSDN